MEPEVIPVVTEPVDPPKQETEIISVSSVCEVNEADEIDSTIQEEASSPPKKAQKVKLVRSPVIIPAEETEEKEPQIVEEKLTEDEKMVVPEKPSEEDITQEEVQIEPKEEETTVAADVLEELQSAAVTLPVMEVEESQQVTTEPIQPLTCEEEMEVDQTLQDVVREVEVEKILPEPILEEEPMVVDDDVKDKNEVEMKEVADEGGPILIDDPVVVAAVIDTEDLTPQINDVPVEVGVLNEIDTTNIVPAVEDQLITESSVIDELIETAALDSIVTESIPEKLEGEDVVDAVNIDPPHLEEVNMETVLEESVKIVLESEAPAKDLQAVLEMEGLTAKSLDADTEKPDVADEKEAGRSEITASDEVSCIPEAPVTLPVAEEQTALKKENMEQVTEEMPNLTDVVAQNQSTAECVEQFEEATKETPVEPPILEQTEQLPVTAHEINPSLQTTLTVDVSEEETTTIYDQDEVARLPSPKAAIKQESQHLLKITISKQADNTHSILKVYNPDESGQPSENTEKVPKISIRSLLSPQESSKKISKVMSPTSVPKVTIKPIMKPDSPVKLTIKPIVKPDEIHEQQQRSSPKLTIKPIIKPDETYEQQRSSPKLTIKPIVKPDEPHEQQKSSPKLTIKPIVKPEEELPQEQQIKTFEVAIQEQDEQQRQARSSPKITIKSVVKHDVEDTQKQKFSPKLTIKPIIKPEETIDVEQYQQKCSPKLTIKPIIKPEETVAQEEQKHPKLTIKPIVRPEEQVHSPKITIKPVVKPQEETETHATRHNLRSTKTEEMHEDVVMKPVEEHEQRVHARGSTKVDCPKVTIKPVIKPAETTSQVGDTVESEEEIKQERIILKINKNTLPSRKREHGDDGGEKLAKIKVKYSKEGGHAHIVPQTIDTVVKHPQPEMDIESSRKRFKLDDINIPQGKMAF